MLEARVIVIVVALLSALAVAAWIARSDRRGSGLLALLSVVWLAVDSHFEGPVLIRFTHSHGFALSDVVGVAGLGLALYFWLINRRPKVPPPSRPEPEQSRRIRR